MWRLKAFIIILIICNSSNFNTALTEAQVEQICQDFEFQFVAHPANQQYYIICVPGGGIEKECPTSQCFDERHPPCSANCNPNTNAVADQAAKEYCNNDDTALLDRVANDKNCASYFICVGKTIDPLPQKCPANQHFSEEHKTCLNFYEANCAASTKWCKKKRNGTRFPHASCHKYYECQDEATIVATCLYGEHFSRDLGKCLSGICQNDKRLPDCKDLDDGVRMAHVKCYKYYVCLNRSVFEAQCPTGFFLKSSKLMCA